MKGIAHYQAASGFHVIKAEFFADPEKDPETVTGAKWYADAPKGYVGGVNSTAWRREMMIDWDAAGGELVFPQFEIYKSRIVIPPFEVPETWALYAGFDYGHRNPSSFHVYAIDHDGNIWVIWEYYKSGQGYRKIAQAIRGCPYYKNLAYLPVADPSIWAKDQQVDSGNEVKSIAQLFFELPDDERVIFAKGKAGGDIAVAEKINSGLWNEEELQKKVAPRLKIFATCEMAIWEIGKLRYSDWSGTMAEQRNVKESIVDKDNHFYDDMKYFMLQFFMTPGRPVEDESMNQLKMVDPASYAEWMRVKQRMGEMASNQGTMGEF